VNSIGEFVNSIGELLFEAEQRLKNADVLRPRRHAELLVETATGLDRVQLYLNAGQEVNNEQISLFQSLLKRREAGEPIQYITGWAPFYGRKFQVGEGVFIPRFETETLIERFLQVIAGDGCSVTPRGCILDLCCGSGIIGLTVAAELPNSHVTLLDVSETALEYCARNAEILGVENRTDILHWNALDDLPGEWSGRFSHVLANPPYVPLVDVAKLPKDVRDGEPRPALTDGSDGLAFYRRWVETIPPVMRSHGNRILFECGDNAAEEVCTILSQIFSDVSTVEDLDGMERVVEGTFR